MSVTRNIYVGQSFVLEAKYRQSDNTNIPIPNPTWAVSDPTILVLSKGAPNGAYITVTGLAAGSANVTATDGTFTATYTVAVTAFTPPTVVDIVIKDYAITALPEDQP